MLGERLILFVVVAAGRHPGNIRSVTRSASRMPGGFRQPVIEFDFPWSNEPQENVDM